MGDLIGYIRLAVSEQLGPYKEDLGTLSYPETANFGGPSQVYAKVYDLPELIDKVSSEYFTISNYSEDPSEYLAYSYLYDNAFDFSSYNTFSINTRRFATFVDSIPFPKSVQSSVSTLLLHTSYDDGDYPDYYTIYSYGSFECDTTPHSKGLFIQIARIGNAMYIVYAHTLYSVPDKKEFSFRRLYGWENAIIYPDTTGNILTIEPSRNVANRPYSLDFVVKYNDVVVDNSEVSFTMYIYKDGTPIENSNLASIVDGHLEVSKLGPTQLYIKAEYGDQSAWSLCESPQFNDPYNPGGTSRPAGGGGSFGSGEVSDDVTGSIPTGTVEGDSSDAGVYTRYLMSLESLRRAGITIWNKDSWVGVLESALDLLLGSKANAMISLMSYPFDISQLSGIRFDSNRALIIGGSRLEITGLYDVLQSSAAQFDWGTVNIEQYYGSFLDYSPYTSIELYLPWGAGFVPIDPNECIPGSIRVVSNIEFDKGNCVHIVTAVNSLSGSETIIGSYSCNVAKEIPLLNTDYSAKGAAIITMAISAATSGAGAAAAANAAEDAASSAYTAALTPSPGYPAPKSLKPAAFEYATNAAAAAYDSVVQSAPKYPTVSATSLINAKPVIQRNGSFTSGSAGLGVQAPYLIISRPDQSVPQEYGHYYGYPSNIYSSLNSLRGYTEVGEIHLKGINCTQKEYEEIVRLLKGGVVF